MIDVLTKKLEDLKKQELEEVNRYNVLSAEKDKCIALVNGIKGAIKTMEEIIKEFNDIKNKK